MRLIDADALMAMCDAPHWCVWMSEIDMFAEKNAVELVRCKDCKFYHDKGYCTKITGLTRIKPDDYCSYGERKDNDRID